MPAAIPAAMGGFAGCHRWVGGLGCGVVLAVSGELEVHGEHSVLVRVLALLADHVHIMLGRKEGVGGMDGHQVQQALKVLEEHVEHQGLLGRPTLQG